MGNSATGSGTNLDKILWARLADHEKVIVANGTINPRRLVDLAAAGVTQSVANSLAVIGVEAGGETWLTTTYPNIRMFGIAPVKAAQAVGIGMPVKSGHDGKVAQFLDAALVSTALGGGEYTTIDGLTFANQPANDTIDFVSSAAGDVTQTITLRGWTNAGAMGTETLAVNGVTQVLGAVAWDTIHAITLSAACAGTLTFHEHSATQTVTTIAPAALRKGRLVASDPRAYYAKIGVVASGACTKKVGIHGKSITGAVQSEEITMNGAVLVPSALLYSEVTYLDIGDVATGTTISATTRATEDNIGTRIGKAITAATAEDDTFYIKLSP